MARDFHVCSAGANVDPVARRLADERLAAAARRADWPAPEVACRLARPSEVPKTARSAQAAAVSNGWTVVATYARGNRVARGNLPGAVVDSLCLRMRRTVDGRRGAAVACWENGSFSMAVDIGGLRRLGYRELLAWLIETG